MNKVLSTILCSVVGINSMMPADSQRPKLVLGIVVDQLRTDYVEALVPLFGENGFRKLMKDGVYLRNVDFKVSGLDAASGTAMVYTGNYPRNNGVASAKVYDPVGADMKAALHDPSAIGNFTEDTYSPAALRLSTLADEIAVDGAGLSAVYSIAPDSQQAIIMAGHAGNSAYWIDPNSGHWATTTYYRDSPRPITLRNYSNSITSRIDTMAWRPLLPVKEYPGLPAQKRMYEFKHRFPLADRDVFRSFMGSPLANAEVTDVAIDYLEDLGLGRRGDAIDMLNVGYTAAPFKNVGDGDLRLELEDTYVRLDRQIGRLFDAVDKYVGLGNTLVFVTSTGYFDDAVVDNPKYRIPTGEFSVKRAMSLLNSYLSAKYGNGSYVDTYGNSHVYLDRKNVEEHGLDVEEVARVSRDFLVRMSGVADAHTMADIMTSALPGMEALRLGTDPKTGGDVVLEFLPGWRVKDDQKFPGCTKVVRSSLAPSPAFIMAPGLQPQTVDTPVDAVAIAPTLTRTLRIRSPNGAAVKPLMLPHRK